MAETSDSGAIEFLNRVTTLVDTLTSLGTDYQIYFESPYMPLEGENEEVIRHADGTFEIVGEETNDEVLQRIRSAVDGLETDTALRGLQEASLHDAACAFDDLRAAVARIAHTDVSESVSPDDDDPLADREHDILKIDVYLKRDKAIDALLHAASTAEGAQPTQQATIALLNQVDRFIDEIASLGIEYQTLIAGYPDLSKAISGNGLAMKRISDTYDTLEPLKLIRKVQLFGLEDPADSLEELWKQVAMVINLQAVGVGIEREDIVTIDVNKHRQRAVETVNHARAALGS